MFGMGFTEILVIAVIAILFLGPDKLPSTMVEIAKFFRSTKNAIGNMKASIEEEMHVTDIKQEALAYKQELEKASHAVTNATNIDSHIDTLLDDSPSPATEESSQKKPQEEVTFKKKKKKKPQQEEENIDV
ncbi:MAG: Sec-independent protein translocase subunit TatB [Epsilonproteobacteria bacterium]|nr:Sec-independent protein translocase subunit TatB [Campylobacterota bacterium]